MRGRKKHLVVGFFKNLFIIFKYSSYFEESHSSKKSAYPRSLERLDRWTEVPTSEHLAGCVETIII